MKLSKFFTPFRTAIIAFVVVLSVLIFGIIPLSLGSIVRDIIVRYAPKAIDADLDLKDVYISILSGEIEATKLKIGNPKGFGENFSIKAPKVEAKAKPLAVFKKNIVIDEVVVEDMLINYLKAGKTTNIDTIQRNVDKSGGDSWLMRDRKFVIKSLLLKNPRVIWHPPLIKKPVTLQLPDIHMKDVGKNGALSSSQVMSMVIAQMLPPVSRAVTLNARDLGKKTKAGAKKFGERVKGLFGR